MAKNLLFQLPSFCTRNRRAYRIWKKWFGLSSVHRYHLFLSHIWSTGQDQVAAIKRQLCLLIPGISIFLDVDDLEDIDALIANGPRDTYLAANGMLTYRAWQKAFLEGETKEKYNPLAVRVVFDPFNACSDAVNPPEAFDYIMKWRREGIQGKESTFGTDLVKSKILSYSAGISFVSIIAFVADIIYEEAVMADISHHLPFMS